MNDVKLDDEAPNNEISNNEISNNETPNKDTSNNETPKKDTSNNEDTTLIPGIPRPDTALSEQASFGRAYGKLTKGMEAKRNEMRCGTTWKNCSA